MKTGVCWWHSKLQRSAIYLAVFDRPTDPKPDVKQVMQLLESIAQRKSVVSIPGFKSWFEFTATYEEQVKFYLGRWEMTDTVQLEFIKGIKFTKGTTVANLEKIEREVNLFQRIAYVLVDLPGMSAHSWLISAFDKTNHNSMNVVDSNQSPFPFTYSANLNRYTSLWEQNHSVGYPNENFNGSILPTRYYSQIGNDEVESLMSLHLQNESDYSDYARLIRQHCKNETPFTRHEQEVRSYKRYAWLIP